MPGVSDAEVAETEYTAFASKKGQAVTARLVVRRVRDLNKQAAGMAGTDQLFPVRRYHAVLTDSPFELVQAEGQHRDHAIVEQVFADVDHGNPLSTCHQGFLLRNAAWLSIAAMAHNLLRAAGRPGQRAAREGPGRDHPPGPDRRRLRPHRPARPRPPHGAPAARLAPRARMAEPLRRGLRAARRSSLTRTRTGPTPRKARRPPRTPSPEPGTQDKPQAGERQDTRAGITPLHSCSCRNSSRKRKTTAIGRWIEA